MGNIYQLYLTMTYNPYIITFFFFNKAFDSNRRTAFILLIRVCNQFHIVSYYQKAYYF
jgi:hypothetical protein